MSLLLSNVIDLSTPFSLDSPRSILRREEGSSLCLSIGRPEIGSQRAVLPSNVGIIVRSVFLPAGYPVDLSANTPAEFEALMEHVSHQIHPSLLRLHQC